MRRRAFITLVGGAAAWPLAAHAQQPAKKMLRVGTVSGSQKSSPQWAAFARRIAVRISGCRRQCQRAASSW